MARQIMMQKVILLIVLSIFLAFVASGISHGNPNTLAQKVYNKHTKTLTRADILKVLPDALEALKSPKVQPLLNDRSIKLIVNNPDLLKTFLPDISDKFIRLLKTDAQIKKLIRDADFQKVLQDPVAIDALVALMTGDKQPEESLVYFREFSTNTILNGERLRVSFRGLRHGSKYPPGSKHKVIVTLTNMRTGTPVASARLSLSNYRNLTATATFRPAVITTDKNGQAETEITFGKQPGNLGIFVELKPEGARVNFGNFGISGTSVDGEKLHVNPKGLVSNSSYLAGSKHKVSFTVIKGRSREPVPAIRLKLSTDSASTTTATFRPAVITTDKNGQAETEITFGKKSGNLEIFVEVKSEGPWVAFWNFGYLNHSVDGEQLHVGIDGLVSQSLYSPGSKHKVSFTVIKGRSREPVPSVRLKLSYTQNSKATARFRPAVIVTNKNGKAETEITFGKQPGHLGIDGQVKSEGPLVTPIIHHPSTVGEQLDLKYTGLTHGPGLKRKVIFTVTNRQSGEPVPSVHLSLSYEIKSSAATATFKPAVITTDKNGQAETEITFSKNSGQISVHVRMEFEDRDVILKITNDLRTAGTFAKYYDITVDGQSVPVRNNKGFETVDLGRGNSRGVSGITARFGLGSTKTRKKLVVKVKGAEQAFLVFSTDREFAGSVTFESKYVRTDNNGRAVTYITFEAGVTDVLVNMKTLRTMKFSVYPRSDSDFVSSITFDGSTSASSSGLFSFRLDTNGKTRKKLVVNVEPRMDIVFRQIEGSVTFESKEVRADNNGQAVTYITFGAGVTNVQIGIRLGFNIRDTNQFGANVYSYSSGHKAVLIKGLRLGRVDTSDRNISDFTDRSYLFSKSGNGFIDKDSAHFELYGQGNINACGHTSARMLLSYYGVDVDLHTFSMVADLEENPTFGAPARTLETVLRGLLPVKIDRYYGTNKNFTRHASLRQKISESRPPIILLRVNGGFGYHYVVVVGYDTKHNKFLIADPGGRGYFHWIPWKYLNTSWHLSFDEPNNYKKYKEERGAEERERTQKEIKRSEGQWYTGLGTWAARFVKPGELKPYTMLVPKEAPPYHHLESETVVHLTENNKKFTVETTFNGSIVEAIAGRIGGIDDIDVRDNKVIVKGSVGPITKVPLGAMYLVVTAYYKPSSAAAPVLSLPPGTTALLPNYPNPFNPETWIPYHLAKPADVALTIYAIDGKVVRHLDLGHQAAGFYQSKSRAAYWDGRNNVGERVASGIYFYTLIAGEFAATQKMLILK